MITNNVKITIAQSIDEAPTYGEETIPLVIEKCIIVKDGMVSGKPSVDLQMVDPEGKKYLVMATGSILEMVAQTIRSVKHN